MSEEKDSEASGSLATITHGASLFFLGRITSNGLGLIFNLILTWTLGALRYGIYTYANTIIGFFVVFARLGTGKSLLRFVPAAANDSTRRNWVVGLAYLTALLGSILASVLLFVLAPAITQYTLNEPLLVDVLQVLAIVLPFNTLRNLTNSVFRASEKLKYQVLISNFINPTLKILAVVTAFLIGLSLVGVVAAIAIASVLSFGAGITILYSKTDIRPSITTPAGSVYDFYNFSLPLTLKDLGQKLYTRIDILMVGFFLTGSIVGIYRVSILLSTFLKLPLSGINQLFPSIASGLYADGEWEELEAVYKIVTRWVFTVSILPTLAMIVYSRQVLRIFGPDFVDGSLVLVLFAVAQLTNSAVGPSGFLLMMTDHQYLNLLNQWGLGVLNGILNYMFIQEFGVVGAAVATAGTLAIINILRVGQVWYTERISPYSTKFWKPLLAGVCAAVTMLGCTLVADGYLLLVFGCVTGSVVFLVALLSFGIEREDREFYAENIKPRVPI